VGEKIVLAGGSGFLGTALADFLTGKGYEPVILTRGAPREGRSVRHVQWDGATLGDWTREIDGSLAVINFTGKSVNCLYTPKNRHEIVRSRLDSVRVLTDAVLSSAQPPAVFVQAGSLAIFGDTEQVCDEHAPHGTGFSVSVCEQWEEAFFARDLPQTRKVLLRIGFALGKNGGALQPLAKLASLGLGGTVGAGRQYISWLHVDDLNRMFLFALENEAVNGILNATGPQAVTNREFMRTMRKVLNKGWALPTPSPFVKLGAYLVMRTDPSLALTGRNCVPAKLLEHGFSFDYPDLEKTLHDLLAAENQGV
jgi:uncharacterized protein (TIGR01777 family)